MFTLETEKAKKSNILEVKIKNYGECGFCGERDNQEILKIPWDIWSQWTYISQRMQDKEWGAIFWVKDNTITGYKIPRQEVTSTDCEFKEELGGDGMIHSHHDMGAFHSSQDDAHARNLYIYSIVTANSKGNVATKRIKLPCGGFGYTKIRLQLVECPEIDLSKINEKKREIISDLTSGFETSQHPCETCSTRDCENCDLNQIEDHMPCENCEIFKCRSCKLIGGIDIRGVLPFCECCLDSGDCQTCEKLSKYLDNYPSEKPLLKA